MSEYPRSRKRIAFLLWRPRYLYSNWLALCAGIEAHGYEVTVFAHDEGVIQRAAGAGLRARRILYTIENLWGRLGPLGRIICWISSWISLSWHLRRFDLVIVPNDNDPLNHLATVLKRSLICFFTLGNFDKNYVVRKFKVEASDRAQYWRERLRMPGIDEVDKILGFHLNRFGSRDLPQKFYSAIGQLQAEHLFAQGIPRHKVFINGSPNFDGLRQILKKDRREVMRSMFAAEITPSTQILSVFPSSVGLLPAEVEFLILAFESLSHSNPDILIAVKLHPRTAPDRHAMLESAAARSTASILINDRPIDDVETAALIAASSAILTSGSNVGFLATILERPIFSYWLEGLPPDIWGASGSALPVDSPADLAARWRSIGLNRPATNPICEASDNTIERLNWTIDQILGEHPCGAPRLSAEHYQEKLDR